MIHPIDYRYRVDKLADYLSPEAILRYQLRVEIAYITALHRLGLCSENVLQEYIQAELKHDVKAVVEALKEQVSESAKPFCHLGLTSYDTNVNAYALLIREVTNDLIIPALEKILSQLIAQARKNIEIVQMGRTHGQHAEPTTFGYLLANFIERLGRGLLRVKSASSAFRGKTGGAVGTKASLDLIANSIKLEAETLALLELTPVVAPSQIANQEELTNFYGQLLLVLGTITDMANDFRQLQRTEIGEVYEQLSDNQVGSSTMPQKKNPIGWENIVSHYKTTAPKLITAYLNIISEHQRDLTDSAANRYLLAEFLNTFLYCVNRATSLLERMEVDVVRMHENINSNNSFWLAEPAYILLALQGVGNAHELVRTIAQKARSKKQSFKDALQESELFRKHLDSLQIAEKDVFEDITRYLGRAYESTEAVCDFWENVLKGE
jgi:adenylosuccinate lyase